MSTQDRSQARRGGQDAEDAVSDEADITVAPTTRSEDLDKDVDALLDEIDEVLEVNAEDFVKSFVQKGGQ